MLQEALKKFCLTTCIWARYTAYGKQANPMHFDVIKKNNRDNRLRRSFWRPKAEKQEQLPNFQEQSKDEAIKGQQGV